VTALQFYESGPGELPPEQRVYEQRFASETSRYINWVLDLEYPAPGSPVDFKVTAIYLRDNGLARGRKFIGILWMPMWKEIGHRLPTGRVMALTILEAGQLACIG
jgi:hypothetical protein